MKIKTKIANKRGLIRVKNGRFAPGNPGGPGRPRRAVEEAYLDVTIHACPPDIWKRICEQAVSEALLGDARARDWLSRYLIGDRPTNGSDNAVPGVFYDIHFGD